jgi:hypothetical protein
MGLSDRGLRSDKCRNHVPGAQLGYFAGMILKLPEVDEALGSRFLERAKGLICLFCCSTGLNAGINPCP